MDAEKNGRSPVKEVPVFGAFARIFYGNMESTNLEFNLFLIPLTEVRGMQEFIGNCRVCGKTIYCENGFLNGTVQEDQTLECFECQELRQESED